MALASLERLKRDHLSQLLETAEHDGALQRCLDAATALIEREVGYTFAAPTAGTRVVYGDGTDYLKLPADYVAGSLTGVTTPTGYTVPEYREKDGYLIVASTAGILGSVRALYGLYGNTFYGGWLKHVPYTIAGTYGYGAAGEDIKRLACEIAVLFWKFRDSGGSEVVGAEGGAAITVRAALSPLQQAVLEAHKAGSSGAGVF